MRQLPALHGRQPAQSCPPVFQSMVTTAAPPHRPRYCSAKFELPTPIAAASYIHRSELGSSLSQPANHKQADGTIDPARLYSAGMHALGRWSSHSRIPRRHQLWSNRADCTRGFGSLNPSWVRICCHVDEMYHGWNPEADRPAPIQHFLRILLVLRNLRTNIPVPSTTHSSTHDDDTLNHAAALLCCAATSAGFLLQRTAVDIQGRIKGIY